MNAKCWYGYWHMNYYDYTKAEIRKKAKAFGIEKGASDLVITFANGEMEEYERHGSRWFTL